MSQPDPNCKRCQGTGTYRIGEDAERAEVECDCGFRWLAQWKEYFDKQAAERLGEGE
jgi:hypothetical protein